MKIIHAADIHLGAKMDSKFPKHVYDKRKEELRNTFKRMVEYAENNGINVIILSGDVFDKDNPYKKDKEFFYSIVRKNPQIDFIYLRGNHDIAVDYDGDPIDNLKVFDNQWKSYTYGKVVISGIEITAENSTSLYSSLSLDKDTVNIVALHGQVGDSHGKDKINLKKLRGKNIDYLALGHVHKYQLNKLDDRAVYCYSGCLEGRGFDEPEEHGFVLLEVDNGVSSTFIPFAERKILIADVDISGLRDAYQVFVAIKEAVRFDKNNIYRVNLTGTIDFDVERLESDVEKYLSAECFYVDVKDCTGKTLDIHKYDGDTSLRGEFVRCVYESPDYTDEEKAKIITYGLKALKGDDIEL
ncbi:MAG: DNA repair exonuclease [Clostridiales bacterium]|nr:DNA repair exonuclease [Clostridiales bacterium]